MHSSPFSWEPGISLTKHHRLLPNHFPGQASEPQQPLNPQCHTNLSHALACIKTDHTTLSHALACLGVNSSDTNVVTRQGLEPKTSRTSVQCPIARPKVRTQARGRQRTTITQDHREPLRMKPKPVLSIYLDIARLDLPTLTNYHPLMIDSTYLIHLIN